MVHPPYLRMIIAIGTLATGSVVAQDRPSRAGSASITVTGCVQRVDESGTLGTIPERTSTPEPAGGRATLGEPGPGFMLTDATPPPAGKGGTRSTRSNMPVRYVLIGHEAELEKYQGQRVRAHGTLPAPSTKPAESAPVGTSGSSQVQSNTVPFKVTFIEPVAGDCK
jgi:hypothetical protein